MKKYIYNAGTVAIAIAMSGLPAVAFAENGGQAQGNGIQVTSVESQVVESRTSANLESTREGKKQDAEVLREVQKQGTETSREVQKQLLEREKRQFEVSRERQKQQLEASSSVQREERKDGREIDLDLEDDSDRATSFEDLKQRIEARKQQLEKEVASTTKARKNIVKNANSVRLAVHALLASKDLVGGIGPQVSEIAKQMNDSVATTTGAEAKIQSRGFLARFLFGGDNTSADVITKEATKNQTRIDSLTALLTQTNVSTEVQAALNEQITALKDAQARLQTLAQREQKAWGLFSWRF